MAYKSGFVINGAVVAPPDGIEVKNFLSDNEVQFKSKPRTSPLQHFVLHETAGKSAIGCKTSLITNGYGVHLILDRNGLVTCHGDLATVTMVHASQLNGTSIGIEVVNPYAPSIAGGLVYDTIPATWWTWCPDKANKKYVLPTAAQLKALTILVPWLCERLGIPYEFPTKDLSAKKPKITGWKKPPLGWYAKPGPGVVAHSDFSSHSDARYILEHLIKNANKNV